MIFTKRTKLVTLTLLFIILSYTSQTQTPQIAYSTYLGGSGWDYGHAITVDKNGYVYIAGQTNSSNYPTTVGAFDRTANGGADILVSKLNVEGNALVYSTYIGGSAFDDTRKVFADKSGNVYLTGTTESSNFPVGDDSLAGSGNGYFLKLDSTGNSIDFSSRWCGGDKILVDKEGYLIILGNTSSTTFPTTENAYSRTLAGGDDLFVAKIDMTNKTVVFSTLIGGRADEWAPSFTLDSQNNIIIAGRTFSDNYPITGNVFTSYTSGKSNVFVTKLKSDGTQLIYSTIIGGSDDELSFDVTADINDNAYVTGVTSSNDFPVSAAAFDTQYSGGQDAFLLKINIDGSQLVYSTYIGGSDKDGGRGVVADKNGKAYLTGCTKSTNFPVSISAYDTTFNGAGTDQWAWGDPFFLIMNPAGTQIEYSTYFGGSNDEEAYGIAMDTLGDIYLCGVTSSNNFPTTEGAYDRTISGGGDIYVIKFAFPNKVLSTDYLGQTPPGDTPTIFAPGIVSVDGIVEHSAPTFSPDGNEVFWQANKLDNQQNWIITCMTMRRVGNTWSAPEATSYDSGPFFSPDGKRVYFESKGEGTDPKYIEKNGDSWSEAIAIDIISHFPELKFAYNLSVAENGNMYFLGYATGYWNNFGLYRAELIDGDYTKPELLPQGINSPSNIRNWTPYIAPDESYLIFSSSRGTSIYDQGDLFLCFHKPDGNWTDPVSLGKKINSNKNERFPAVSPDGKYLLFTRSDDEYDEGVLWVSASIIDSLKAVVTNVKENGIGVNKSFKLNQNYPNPFNPSTTIRYLLVKSSHINLTIHNLLGQKIKTLVNCYKGAGEHSIVWDATNDESIPVSSGIYFYKLGTCELSLQKKMLLIR